MFSLDRRSALFPSMLYLLSLPRRDGRAGFLSLARGRDACAAVFPPTLLYSAGWPESDSDQGDDRGEPIDPGEARMRNEQKIHISGNRTGSGPRNYKHHHVSLYPGARLLT